MVWSLGSICSTLVTRLFIIVPVRYTTVSRIWSAASMVVKNQSQYIFVPGRLMIKAPKPSPSSSWTSELSAFAPLYNSKSSTMKSTEASPKFLMPTGLGLNYTFCRNGQAPIIGSSSHQLTHITVEPEASSLWKFIKGLVFQNLSVWSHVFWNIIINDVSSVWKIVTPDYVANGRDS